MGLFNRFKNVKINENLPKTTLEQPSLAPTELYKTEDGKDCYLIDYYEPGSYMRQAYDTTRLIINQEPEVLPSGKQVYCAQISWYGRSDCDSLDGSTKFGRKYDLEDIRLQVDLEKLMFDKEYQSAVMTKLLTSKRVEKYLNQGLEENPKYKCGNYVGYIDKNSNGEYAKFFDAAIGREVHNLPDQVKQRAIHKQKMEAKAFSNNQKRENIGQEMEL